jgi:hypothetical protein
MPLNAGPVVIADALGATVAAEHSIAVRTDDQGIGSERTRAGKRCQLDIIRADTGGAAVVGTIAVNGADLPNPDSGKPLGNAFATAQAEQVKSFTAVQATAAYTPTGLVVPAAVGSGVAKEGVFVETDAFILTATALTSAVVTAGGVFTVTGGDLTGATAAATHLSRALPEVEPGDVVAITGTVNGVAGVTVTGIVTPTTTVTATAFSWDQTVAVTAGYVVNLSQSKRFKLPVTLATVAGPRTVGLTSVTAGDAIVCTFAAPIAGAYVPAGARINVYAVTPTEILAAGAHMVEKVAVRSRTMMWIIYSGIQTAANRTLVTLSHLVD